MMAPCPAAMTGRRPRGMPSGPRVPTRVTRAGARNLFGSPADGLLWLLAQLAGNRGAHLLLHGRATACYALSSCCGRAIARSCNSGKLPVQSCPEAGVAPRILAVLGPKGGVGKSTIASNLLVAALLDGVVAAGLDLDSQGSLMTWGQDRLRRGRQPPAAVTAATVGDWRAAVARERSRALVVFDCPPSLEDQRRLAEVLALARAATLVLVPTLPMVLACGRLSISRWCCVIALVLPWSSCSMACCRTARW